MIRPLTVIPCVDELPRLEDCIGSILGAGVAPTDVIVVVDGGTTAADHIRDDGVRVVGSPRRGGFASACNFGADALLAQPASGPSALVFVNDDATMPSGWTATLELLTQSDVGAVAWSVRGPHGPRRIYPSSAFEHAEHARAHTGATLSGCAFAVRSDQWVLSGGLDPRFVMYGEETDLFLGLQERGLQLVEDTSRTVWHEGEGSMSNRRIKACWYGIRNPLWVSVLHDTPARMLRTLAVTTLDVLSLRRLRVDAEPHRRRRRAASWPVRQVLLWFAVLSTMLHLPSLIITRRVRADRNTGTPSTTA